MNEDLSQMVGKIMASPGFEAILKDMKQTDSTAKGEAKGNSIENLPSANELAAKLPAIMNALGAGSAPSSAIDSKTIDKAMSALRKMDSGNCSKLLSALKPYLNKERGEVIDKAVSVMKITDLFGAMGDIPGMPKSE